MIRRMRVLSLLLAALALPAFAGDKPTETAAPADPAKTIAAKLPGIDPTSIKAAPIEGVYEVGLGANIAYVSSDARYLLRGDLIDLDSDVNLTEQSRSRARVAHENAPQNPCDIDRGKQPRVRHKRILPATLSTRDS